MRHEILEEMEYEQFQNFVHAQGRKLYRDMPWRRDTRAYYVLVSELMLQQTQVGRVVPKFEAFVQRFSDIESLATAPLSDVLRAWTGLGYNRRAKYLHEAAKEVLSRHGGQIPDRYDDLKALPGIGPATAGAIMVYAFNQPIVFIETNVRTVYFYHFFEPHEKVSDTQLVPLVEATLDCHSPREFYWALMDYGSWLKQSGANARNSQSIHYQKQSKFDGSLREMRGRIVRVLGEADMTLDGLQQRVGMDERFKPALDGLVKEGLVIKTKTVFGLGR